MSLKQDAFLLVDVTEKFRNNSIKNYTFCPSNFLSASFLSWDANLKWQKMSLNLLQIMTSIYSLKKVEETEFLIFLIDSAKRYNIMYIYVQTIYIILWSKPRIKTYYILIDVTNLRGYSIS